MTPRPIHEIILNETIARHLREIAMAEAMLENWIESDGTTYEQDLIFEGLNLVITRRRESIAAYRNLLPLR